MKTKKLLLVLSVLSLMTVPMFAAQLGGFGEFRFSGSKKQAYSFTQRAFSVTDNLWNKHAKETQDSLNESADQVELFIGRIGESSDTKDKRKQNIAMNNAVQGAKNLRNAGIALTIPGGMFSLAGLICLAVFCCFSPTIGLCFLGMFLPGLSILGAGVGLLAYSFHIGGGKR